MRSHIVTLSLMSTGQLDLVCRAVGDPTRRAILDRLREGELTAGGLAEAFPISRPAVSRHLRVLREAELLKVRQEGRQRIYQLTPQPLATMDSWLTSYRVFWAARLADLKRVVEARERSDQ